MVKMYNREKAHSAVYYGNELYHSTGVWEKHKYVAKEEKPNGKVDYIYPGEKGAWTAKDADFDEKNFSESNKLGNSDFYGFKRADGTSVILNGSDKWELKDGKSIDAGMISRLEKIDRSKTSNEGISALVGGTHKSKPKDAVATDDKTSKKGKGGGGKGKGGSKGKSSGKAGSGKSSGGKSGKSGSDKSGAKKAGSTDSKKASKEAKKQQKAQKDYQKELQKIKDENKRKQDEQFNKRKQENEKRWAADQERYEKMRDTSRESVSKETLNEIIDMLEGSDKEYAKKLLESGRSKVDDYLDWIKESRKNN